MLREFTTTKPPLQELLKGAVNLETNPGNTSIQNLFFTEIYPMSINLTGLIKQKYNENNNNKKPSMMNGIEPHFSILTLNVNGPNTPLRYRTAEWIRIHQTTIFLLQETHLT